MNRSVPEKAHFFGDLHVFYSPATQVRATVAAETVAVSEDRVRVLEFQFVP